MMVGIATPAAILRLLVIIRIRRNKVLIYIASVVTVALPVLVTMPPPLLAL